MYEGVRTKSGDTLWVRTATPYFLRNHIARIEFDKFLNRRIRKAPQPTI